MFEGTFSSTGPEWTESPHAAFITGAFACGVELDYS